MYPDIKETIPDSKKNFLTWFSRGAINLRTEVEKIYNHYLGEPEASLLSGIVLGVKRGLPQEFADSLQKTGTLHIIVASGYNVTIIIGTIITLIAGLIRRQWAILIGILAVFGYTIMAGAEPAIVRAAIMGSLAYFGQVLGKQSEGIRLLVVAGLTMILVNPFFLLDLGFQLSFMATLGLLLMADHFPQVIAETTAAQIMVWPIILINFGQLSLFSILVNILILWLVPYIMVLGAALALVGWIKPVGAVLGMIAYLPLHLMTVIINWFGEQSWISWQLEGVSWIFGALYYLILGAVLIKLNHVNPKKVV
jgi:competence protein ComEC